MGSIIKRVLMVDDDIDLCESMGDYLADRGDEYKYIGGACNFSSAIELFKDGMPNIVILDMMLGPGQDGSDLVEEFRRIEKEQGFKTNIFVLSKSSVYENYCVQNQLIFMQKGENNPELIIKRIERFVDTMPSVSQIIKVDITPPKTRKDRMKDNLWYTFSNVGAHTYGGCDDCMYIIPRLVELKESGSKLPLEQVYEEWSVKCKSTREAIEGRIRNMLKSLWSKASLDSLKQFYPPDIGKHTYPTPLPFIDYHAKRLMREYPRYVEKP